MTYLTQDHLHTLQALPQGIAEAESLLEGIDTCFESGFSRLGQSHFEHLIHLTKAFRGTPLGERIQVAVEAMSKADFSKEHFVALAAARAALAGAQYDALLSQARAGLGRDRPPVPQAASKALSRPMANWSEATGQWLIEVALSGFRQLAAETVAPFDATLSQIQADGSLPRLGALLTGMTREWLSSMPMASMPVIPVRRWADLWTRAMVLACGKAAEPMTQKVKGEFFPLAVDLRHHSNMVSALFWGPLKGGDTPRMVRVTLTAYKVDAITGDEMWQAFDQQHEPLLMAYTKQTSMGVEMECSASGDLLWDPTKATKGKPFKIAAELAMLTQQDTQVQWGDLAPLERHPALLAEPVMLQGYTLADDTLRLGDQAIGIDTARISDESPLHTSSILAKTSECFGLLRFDKGWAFQPLLAISGAKVIRTGDGATTKGKSSDAIAILQERASKLLRK